MTSPRLGYVELVAGQAVPESTVNEMARYLEQGANIFVFKSRTTTAEPGSPADGDCYLLPTSPTGTHWSGNAGKIAFYENTAWVFLTVRAGYCGIVADQGYALITYNGSVWRSAVEVALTDGATITPDFSVGNNFSVTLGGNRTLANPTNAKSGQSGLIVVTQDGTGSRTLAYGTNWKFPGGAPVLSTAIGAIDSISYFVRPNGTILATLSKAFA